MQEPADLYAERPVVAVGVTAAVAAVGYAIISLLLYGAVNPVQTAIFAVVFAVVYYAFLQYFG